MENQIGQSTTISEEISVDDLSNTNIVEYNQAENDKEIDQDTASNTNTRSFTEGIGTDKDKGITYNIDINDSLIGVRRNKVEEMYKLYCDHAKAIGFSVRKSTSRFCDNGFLYEKSFVCSNEGVRRQASKSTSLPDPDDETYTPRKNPITRTNCKAAMKVKWTDDDCYKVTEHVLEHNHQLTRPEFSHFHRSQRQITSEKGKAIEDMVVSGIRASDSYRFMAQEAGGYDCIGHTMKDHINYVNRVKQKERENGDAHKLVELLYKQQSEEDDFFFRIMLDDTGRLSSIFWRDSMMKEDYSIYGDVMVFDTTYATNKYGMICAPIVGINNHRKNIMFGCAFLANEETKSFEWLFDTFKKSMGGKCPITIFTDQDQAMTNAISTAFPSTKHRLCQWHLYQNAISRFGQLKSNNKFKDAFKKCMSGCVDEIHFEKSWFEMIQVYHLENEAWFKRLYDLRHKWSTALNKDFFSASILSSQRSESTNSAMGNKVKKTTSLTDFHYIFQKLLENWRMNERQDEFKSSKSIPASVVPLTGLLKHASEIYTLEVFDEFQKQFIQSVGRKCQVYDKDEMITTYSVSAYESKEGLMRYVMVGQTPDFLQCSCKYFEECGIMCRHMIRVLYQENHMKIPEKFILKRWTRTAKSSVWDIFGSIQSNQNSLSVISWNHEMTRKYYNLLLDCKDNEEARKILEESYERDLLAVSSLKGQQEQSESSHVSSTATTTIILDPACSVTKGRKKRVNNGIEKGKKKKTSEAISSEVPREFGTKTPNIRLF